MRDWDEGNQLLVDSQTVKLQNLVCTYRLNRRSYDVTDEKALERELDLSQQLMDRKIAEHAERSARNRPTGRCLYCNEVLPPDRSFCPPEAPGELGCRDDYEAEQAALTRAGRTFSRP